MSRVPLPGAMSKALFCADNQSGFTAEAPFDAQHLMECMDLNT
jgi:hypothetical protein